VDRGQLLYEGKAKRVYETSEADRLILEFKDTATANDGAKSSDLDDKGRINNCINAFVMGRLQEAGVPVGHLRALDDTRAEVKRLDMLPVEAVVRNVCAGSLARRLGKAEGTELSRPVFELFYKSDELGDPLINRFHVLAFDWATQAEVDRIIDLSFRVNDVLVPLFRAGGLTLVDYKLEFGRFEGQLLLGDEFTPDGCRLWDAESGEKLDKDRFRRDLGDVMAGYREIGRRLGVDL
jgi:phosphoribosylaminoimidazole-succinocarboxamide synthase